MASEHGCHTIVPLLLELSTERCVRPVPYHSRAVAVAAENGHTEVRRLLLELHAERGVDPAAGGNSALTQAAAGGHVEVVKLLLLRAACRSGVDAAATMQCSGHAPNTDPR